MKALAGAALAAALMHSPVPARAQGGPPALADKVLVVYNKAYRESRDVADYYMAARHIPKEHACAVDLEEIGGYIPGALAGYHDKVKQPIQKCLNKIGREQILYIVFSYRTPFKVWDEAFPGSARAIDSLVADIWNPIETTQSINRYYRRDSSAANVYAPFVTLQAFRAAEPTVVVYSVWRLDNVNVAYAKGLVDKAIAAESKGLSGQGCFDRRYPTLGADTNYGAGDWDIQKSADFVKAAGFAVTLDTTGAEFGTAPAPLRCENAAFYGGWYSVAHYNDAFSWAPGAMGWHLDSLSLTDPRTHDTWTGGALARGITITTGVVAEPYLDNVPHLDSFFRAVLGGANVGDAMLRSTPLVNWMNINVGDPLYAPFAGRR